MTTYNGQFKGQYPYSYGEIRKLALNVINILDASNEEFKGLLSAVLQKSINIEYHLGEYTLGFLLEQNGCIGFADILYKIADDHLDVLRNKEVDYAPVLIKIMEIGRYQIIDNFHVVLDFIYAFKSNDPNDLSNILTSYGRIFREKLDFQSLGLIDHMKVLLPAINSIIAMDIEDMEKGRKQPHKLLKVVPTSLVYTYCT